MAERTFLREAAEDTIEMAAIAGEESVGTGKFKARLIVSEGAGEEEILPMAILTARPQRTHMRIHMTGFALCGSRPDRRFGSVANHAINAIMRATKREFTEIVETGFGRKSLRRVATLAGRSERTFMSIVMTCGTLLFRNFVPVIDVALIAGHPNMLSIQAEARLPVVVKFDIVVSGRRVATIAFLSQLSFVKIVVASLAPSLEGFVSPFHVA